jgi:uncharacterized membrane protein required for colicin V production
MGSLNILDIAIIAIMLIFSLSGFARGFLASLLKLFSSVVSLAIAVWLAKPVAVFINSFYDLNAWFSDKISAAIINIDEGFFSSAVTEPTTGADLKNSIAENVDGLSDVFKTALRFLIRDDVTIETGTVVGEWIGQMLAGIAMLVTATIAVYIAIRIAVAILSRIFDAITKSPAIGGLDRLLGLAFGAVKGAFIIAVVFAVYSVIVIVPGVESATSSILDGSTIGKPVYDMVSEFVVNYIGDIDFNAIIQGAFNNIH